MSWFGFDFNGDDKVDFGEHMLTMDMLGFFDDDNNAQVQDKALECEMEHDALQLNIEALEGRRSSLEDALFDLEMNAPDICSPAYDAWEARRDTLQDQIYDLDSGISDLDCCLSDFDTW